MYPPDLAVVCPSFLVMTMIIRVVVEVVEVMCGCAVAVTVVVAVVIWLVSPCLRGVDGKKERRPLAPCCCAGSGGIAASPCRKPPVPTRTGKNGWADRPRSDEST